MKHVYSHITGPLPPNSSLYIEREADLKAIEHLRRMDYIQLSEPHQQGKTSLIYRIRDMLNSPTCTVVYVNVASLNKSTQESWYSDLRERLIAQLEGFIRTEDLTTIPCDTHTWRSFLRSLVTTKARKNAIGELQFIIALDEIEDIPSQWAASFFKVLGEVYHSRYAEEHFQRLSFILSGSFNLNSITANTVSSLSNVVQRIDLKDFTTEHIKELLPYPSLSVKERSMAAGRLYYWTDGQPYLTQCLCRYLEDALNNGASLSPTLVDEAVGGFLQRDDNHLFHIILTLNKNAALQGYMLRAITKPLRLTAKLNSEQFQLVYVYGLLKADEQGFCRIRNRIYQIALKMGPLWEEWEQRIVTNLKHTGEVTQAVSDIPEFAWQDVISLLKEKEQEYLPIDETKSGRVILLRGALWVKELHTALQMASNELSNKSRALDSQGSLVKIMELLEETMGLKRATSIRSRGRLRAVAVKGSAFKSLRGRIPENASLIFLPTSEISSRIDSTLASFAGEIGPSHHFTLLIPLSSSIDEEHAELSALSKVLSRSPYEFVVLSRDELLLIFIDSDPPAAFLRCIAKQVSPQTVSPFIIQGNVLQGNVEADIGMFYGREKEVGRILGKLRSQSFTIIGNRLIGKSSLLGRIQQRLDLDPNYYVKSYDYQSTPSLSPQEVRDEITHLEQQAKGRLIVQLIDEPDLLLENDAKNNYLCSAVWRELSAKGRCQFVFAGHRVLRRCLSDVRSPFFNFVTPIPLGFLDYAQAWSLLTEPLYRIGFQLEDEDRMLEMVWQVSSGHPNIIQVIGQELMEQLKKGDMLIRLEHLQHVLSSRTFLEACEKAIWGGERVAKDYGVSPLERLIVLLGNPGGFTRDAIERILRQNKIAVKPGELDNALNALIDFDLLDQHMKQNGTEYICNVRDFRRMVLNHYHREYLLDMYREALKS